VCVWSVLSNDGREHGAWAMDEGVQRDTRVCILPTWPLLCCKPVCRHCCGDGAWLLSPSLFSPLSLANKRPGSCVSRANKVNVARSAAHHSHCLTAKKFDRWGVIRSRSRSLSARVKWTQAALVELCLDKQTLTALTGDGGLPQLALTAPAVWEPAAIWVPAVRRVECKRGGFD